MKGEGNFHHGTKALQIPNTPLRYQAMLWALRAKSFVTSDWNPKKIPVNKTKNIEVWFLEATKAIEKSKMTGVTLPDLPIIERTIAQQQETLLEKCSVSTP